MKFPEMPCPHCGKIVDSLTPVVDEECNFSYKAFCWDCHEKHPELKLMESVAAQIERNIANEDAYRKRNGLKTYKEIAETWDGEESA